MAIANNSTTSTSGGIYGWSELWVKLKLRFIYNIIFPSANKIYWILLLLFISVVNVMHAPLHLILPNPVCITLAQIYQEMYKYRRHIRILWNVSLNAFPSILKRNSRDVDSHIRKSMAPSIPSKKKTSNKYLTLM